MRLLNKKILLGITFVFTYGTSTLFAQDINNDISITSKDTNTNQNTPIIPPKPTVSINQDPKIKKLINLKTKMDKDGRFGDRYKIQLYYGNLKGANAVIKKYKEAFSEWPHTMEYETPNHKIWVGNFRNKLEADRALLKIKEKFPNAFKFRPDKR